MYASQKRNRDKSLTSAKQQRSAQEESITNFVKRNAFVRAGSIKKTGSLPWVQIKKSEF